MSKLRSKYWFITISKNTRFRRRDQLMYALVVFFSLGGLIFPLIPFKPSSTIQHPGCAFKALTTLPCPSCGYTRSLGLLSEGAWHESFLFNPFTIFYVALMLSMASLGILSFTKQRHFNFSKTSTLVIIGVLLISWVAKFVIGPQYY